MATVFADTSESIEHRRSEMHLLCTPSAEIKKCRLESGQGSRSSQVTFSQLGMKEKEALLISIHHPPANITGAMVEIPGDEVLAKNKDAIIVSACNVYFEAKRVSKDPRSR